MIPREVWVFVLASCLPLSAQAAPRMFRPLMADPRENQFRMKWVRSTENWRYGTDIADSTTQGGYESRTGITWDVGFGETFRAEPWEKLFGLQSGLWKRYQVGIPAGVFANFHRGGAELINADYQFGMSTDFLLRGKLNEHEEIDGFSKAVWVLRAMIYHRSTHLGDEYLSQGAFGDNQDGFPDSAELFQYPPVKRFNLSFESARFILSSEAAPRWLFGGEATLRGYLGFEKKFKIATQEPSNFRSAIYQAGFEFHSQGNVATPRKSWFSWLQNRVYPPGHGVVTEWVAAMDFKLAKPYEFALADAAHGATSEAWTSHLWTNGTGGREFQSYAGSWHFMLGIATYQRNERDMTRSNSRPPSYMPPVAILGLDWYAGYSSNGQFLDQKLQYRPWWVPSLTVHF